MSTIGWFALYALLLVLGLTVGSLIDRRNRAKHAEVYRRIMSTPDVRDTRILELERQLESARRIAVTLEQELAAKEAWNRGELAGE